MDYIIGILQICELQCSLINKITDKELLNMHIVSVTQTQNMLSRSLSVNKSINDITTLLEFSVIQNNIIKLINPSYTKLYNIAKQNFSLMISLISAENPMITLIPDEEQMITHKHWFAYTLGITLNIVQDENLSVINHSGGIRAVSICAKNKIIVTCTNCINFWNLENNEHLYTFNTDCIYGVAIATDFIMSYSMEKNHILILNYLTQKDDYITIPNSLPPDSRIIISANNKFAAILTHEKRGMRDILIYTIDITKKVIGDSIKYKRPENAQEILCDMDFIFIEDRLYYAYTSGYPNRFVIIEEINTGFNDTNIRHCYKIPQQTNIISNIKLIPNSKLIAFISNKISLCIYNYESVERIFSININAIHQYDIYGDYICILDQTSMVRIYNVRIYNYRTNTLEREIKNNINSNIQNINICYYVN